VDTWRELVRARDEGLVRSIGVSNYSLDQVDVLTTSTGVPPAVNQVPWSPRQFDGDVLTGHRQRGVVLQGYSPLSSGSLTAEPVRELAERHGVTPTQVVLRWHLQHRVATIPRSANRDHITANRVLEGFDLSPTELATLDALGS
jgi:diketogulonate reductase-like aldo/keto reductase